MARRQIVGHGVNLELYAATHGEPNIIGQAIGGVGTVLGEAFDQAKKKKNKADKEASQALSDLNKRAAEAFAPDTGTQTATLESINSTIDSNRVKFNEIEKKRAAMGPPTDDVNIEDPKKGITDPAKGKVTKTYEMYGDEVYSKYLKDNPGQIFAAQNAKSNAILAAKASNMSQYGTYEPTATGQADNKVEIDENGNLVTTPISRLKSSPFGRKRGGQRGSVIQGINSLTNTGGGVQTSAADRGETSRFTPGRTFVEKERRLSAPSWMGIGAAAIEGWNLGVEKENYKKQVRADLQDYYQQEFKGLEVGRTGNDLFDQSMQEILMGEKKKLAQKLQDRDAAFARGEGATWTAEYGQMKKVPTQIANLVDGVKTIRKDILDKYDQIDWAAMSDEQVDEVMTYLKGGSALGLAQTESGLSVLGATRGNMPYVKDIQALTQEGGGPKIILKKNPFNYVASVVEEIRKNPSRYSYTDEVNGIKTTKMLPMEQLMPYLNSMFDQELTDKSDIRAYSSTSNWDEDGMTPELFDISVNDGNDPKDFVKKKFAEIATNLLYPQQQVFDRQGTARSTQLQREQIKIREEERNSNKDNRTSAQKNADTLSKNRSTFANNILGIYSSDLNINKATAAGEPGYELAKSIPGIQNAYEENGILILTDKNDDEKYFVDLSDFSKAKRELMEIQAGLKFKPEAGGLKTGEQQDISQYDFNIEG
jgi:hypothetical protein